MPLRAAFLTDDPAVGPASTPPAVYGQRAALVLGASMVVALAFVTLLRWSENPSSAHEIIVQQPIPADTVTSSPRVDLTAPDPGDSPP